jgi:hypothetical protein
VVPGLPPLFGPGYSRPSDFGLVLCWDGRRGGEFRGKSGDIELISSFPASDPGKRGKDTELRFERTLLKAEPSFAEATAGRQRVLRSRRAGDQAPALAGCKSGGIQGTQY